MSHLNPLILPVISTPSELSELALGSLYFKTDGKLYKRNSQGLEQKVVSVSQNNSMVMELTNQEVIGMEYGHLVLIDTVNPLSVKFNTVYFGTGLIGVVLQGGGMGQQVLVQFGGVIDVQMDSTPVNVGDYIIGSSIAGKATAYFSEFIGVIGRALESKGAVEGTIKVFLSGGLPEIF